METQQKIRKSVNFVEIKTIPMKVTAIKKELNTYLPLLTEKQQELLLNMVKSILHVETSSQRISVKQYNKEIAESEKQIADGKYTTQEDLEKEVKGW